MEKAVKDSILKSLLSSPSPFSDSVNSVNNAPFYMGNVHNQMVPQVPAAPEDLNEAVSSIKIQNVVSTVNLGCALDLKDINFRTRNSEYTPAKFIGVIMRIREPRCTALIFGSGKLICTGARNKNDSLLASRKFARIIQLLGYKVKFIDYKVQNMVASADLRFPIRLEDLNHSHGQFCSYEPELFPGLIYRLVKPKMVLLIFVNGKIVFTGAKSKTGIRDCMEIVYPVLQSYRKN